MTYYLVQGNNIDLAASDSMKVLDHLPADMYTVRKNEMTGQLYLQTTNRFELPSKIYGEPTSRVERIMNTFYARPRSTGVLLTGDKGSGKTLLAKCLANQMIEDGYPVVVVNEPWCGEKFNELIGKIKQPALVLFDEFDKVYDEDDQKVLLTLLDGVVETKKLFVLTTNSRNIDKHMINRPGRIYYSYAYEGIDSNFVREYATDNLKDQSLVQSLVTVSENFSSMTFDMMQALIEEMNRYGEDAIEVMKHINVDITAESVSYIVSVLYNGVPVTNTYYPYTIDENPLFASDDRYHIEIYTGEGKTIEDKRKELPDTFLNKDSLLSVTNGGVLTFGFTHKTKNDLMIVLERKRKTSHNWGMVL